MNYAYSLLILIIPLTAFLLIGLTGSKWKPSLAGIAGTTGLLIITILSWYTAYLYFSSGVPEEGYQSIEAFNVLWLTFTEQLQIHLGILLDPLSVMMLVVITTVSLMVHIYSLGYMKGENGFQRYYAFLSLFTFFFQARLLGGDNCQVETHPMLHSPRIDSDVQHAQLFRQLDSANGQYLFDLNINVVKVQRLSVDM